MKKIAKHCLGYDTAQYPLHVIKNMCACAFFGIYNSILYIHTVDRVSNVRFYNGRHAQTRIFLFVLLGGGVPFVSSIVKQCSQNLHNQWHVYKNWNGYTDINFILCLYKTDFPVSARWLAGDLEHAFGMWHIWIWMLFGITFCVCLFYKLGHSSLLKEFLSFHLYLMR